MSLKSHDIIDTLVFDWKKERPDLDASPMLIVGRLLKLGKILEKSVGKSLVDSGIHYTDLDVLATIRRSGKPYKLSPKQLMGSVLITSGAMTALLDRLTKMDLIYRTSDSKDGRVKLACLTEKGKIVIDKAIVTRFNEAKYSTAMLTNDEKIVLSRLLKKMILNLHSA